VQRRRHPDDRRLHALHITDAGEALLHRLGRTARTHDDLLCAVLDDSERRRLRDMLVRIAQAERLPDGVHPGYRDAPGR